MPLGAFKTILQVEGDKGVAILRARVKAGGLGVMYHGSLAAMAATYTGSFPWFLTYNTLDASLPPVQGPELLPKVTRAALIGFASSLVSDCLSNPLRVIVTSRQTYQIPTSYTEIAQNIIKTDGVLGLMGRGLTTRLIANSLQSMAFTILWRLGQDAWTDTFGQSNVAAEEERS
eukprot:gene26067-11770_t